MSKKNLLIDYDEAACEIRFFEVSLDGKKSLAIKVPLSLYQEQSPDQAERLMGETVFTFFDQWAHIKMGLRNYVEDSKRSLATGHADIEKLAQQENADAQYQLAIDCFTVGVSNRSAGDIERAESWLQKAAANGSREAVDYLRDHWERDKNSALRGMQ